MLLLPRLPLLLLLAVSWAEYCTANATATATAAKPMTRLDCWRRNAPGMHAADHHGESLAEPGRGWHVLPKACRTAFLLNNSMAPLSTPGAGILFLGDSVDAFNMYELCDAVNATKWHPGNRREGGMGWREGRQHRRRKEGSRIAKTTVGMDMGCRNIAFPHAL